MAILKMLQYIYSKQYWLENMKIKDIENITNEIEIRLTDLGSELLELRAIKSDIEKVIKDITTEIVGMLETIDSKSFETDDLKVSKQDVSRTVIDNKVAKVVIPKKYLDQIMKTTEFSKVLVKEVQNGTECGIGIKII